MLWQSHSPDSKWYNSDKHIDKWLRERQELLSLYYKVLQISPFKEENEESCTLDEFCTSLVDYVCKGHFDIFEKLFSASLDQDNSEYNSKIIQEILRTTLVATEFNSKYSDREPDDKSLKTDLSELGEQLAKRMDLEDKLINMYIKLTNSNASKEQEAS